MRMRSHYRRDAPVEVPAHRYFFAGGLGMHIDENEGHILRQLSQFAIRLSKRIIDWRHEDATLQVEHGVLHAILRRANVKPPANIAFWEVRRPQQPWLVGHEFEDFLAVPAVIAAGENVNAQP